MFVSPSGRLARDLSAIRLATTVNATFRRMSRSNELHVQGLDRQRVPAELQRKPN
jgi:hypothetical protein